MTTRETVRSIGARRSAWLRARFVDEVVALRLASGLSKAELARSIGVSEQTWARAERGAPGTLTVDLAARMAPALGNVLAMSLHPIGDPVRDRAHLALLARLRARLGNTVKWRAEVPVPIAGDRRSGDAVIGIEGGDILVEAETRLGDVQAMERKAAAKMRDLGARRLVILVAGTVHNPRVIREHPDLRDRFPVGTRAAISALRHARDPGSDALIVL